MDELDAALREIGFEPVDPAVRQSAATEAGMSENGDYRVLLDFRRGDTTVFVEQTSVRRNSGPTVTTATYPQVCVIEGPDGRVACDPSNIELVLSLVGE